jgi:PBSX family phage terminase large subunit
MTLALTHEYRPRGSAIALFNCRDSEVLISGPAGTGKSRACLEKLHILCLKNPGITCLITRKTLASLGSTALKTYREIVAVEAIESGLVDYYGGSDEKPPQYRYYNAADGGVGSIIVIGGMDKPSKIMSSEYDVIYVQEAVELTIEDWEALTTRQRNWKLSFQQIIADTNPERPTHWLKRRNADGSLTLFESRHEENPELFDENGDLTERGKSYMWKLDRLTGVRRLRLRDGLWVAAEGIIYDEFDPAVHLIDRFDIPDNWVRWWGVDFGYTHPFVLQRWAEDGDGRLFLYAEQYQTRTLVEDHARNTLSQVCPGADEGSEPGTHGVWREPKPQTIICDHQASDRATLERHLGLSTVPAYKAVTTGIQAVQSRLRLAGDSRARLFCHARQCVPYRSGSERTQSTHKHRRGIQRLHMGRYNKRATRQRSGRRHGRHALRGCRVRFGCTSANSLDGRR